LLVDLAFLALGLFVVARHRTLAREQLQFQKEVLKLRDADDPRTIRSSEIVYLIVGAVFALWSLARLLGLIVR
jgi:hypothetical protein